MPPNAAATALAVQHLVTSDLVAVAQCIALDVGTFPHPSARFALRPARCPVWVARLGGASRVIGFLAATERPGGDLYIDGLATDRDARRQGASRALLRAAIAHARAAGAETLSLHVWTGNRAAMALYRSEAFDVQARIPGYYQVGAFASDDAYRMARVVQSRARLEP